MNDKVIEMYLKGFKMDDIAKEFGTYRHIVSKILHENNIKTSRHELLKGQQFTTNSGDLYTVIEDFTINGRGMCKIKFKNSGYETIASSRDTKRGCIRDYYKRKIYGVGCKGRISCPKDSLASLCFHRWEAMLCRCYNPNCKGYSVYGAKGVRVSDDWLVFENFFRDLPNIPGFDEEKYINHEIELDKDTKSDTKVYSLETCVFLPIVVNRRFQKVKPFKAISPSGEIKYYKTQTECARDLGLLARSIGKCLNKQLKHHHGYSFEYLEPQTTIPNGSSE